MVMILTYITHPTKENLKLFYGKKNFYRSLKLLPGSLEMRIVIRNK